MILCSPPKTRFALNGSPVNAFRLLLLYRALISQVPHEPLSSANGDTTAGEPHAAALHARRKVDLAHRHPVARGLVGAGDLRARPGEAEAHGARGFVLRRLRLGNVLLLADHEDLRLALHVLADDLHEVRVVEVEIEAALLGGRLGRALDGHLERDRSLGGARRGKFVRQEVLRGLGLVPDLSGEGLDLERAALDLPGAGILAGPGPSRPGPGGELLFEEDLLLGQENDEGGSREFHEGSFSCSRGEWSIVVAADDSLFSILYSPKRFGCASARTTSAAIDILRR